MSVIPFEKVRSWVFDHALPRWASAGVDRSRGGFFEELSLAGAPTACGYKRVRTMCRQTYVFSHAAVLGWAEGEALSRLGCEYLFAKARLPSGAWARRLTAEGAVLDATPDLYDLAFVIFAMAWQFRATGEHESRKAARETLDFIRAHMAGPDGGFWSTLPPSGPRPQNPHMHLTEACLAAFEATEDEIFLQTATDLVELMRRRFLHGGTLGEQYSNDWIRLHGALEPGHHFEWVWIVAQHAKLTGSNQHVDVMQALLAFAEQHGVSTLNGAVFDSVAEDGAPVRTSSRVWTNTERIKAHLAAYEIYGHNPIDATSSALAIIFGRYFAAPAAPGMWIDQFDHDCVPLVDVAPASCLYHLFLAFSEVLRLESSLEAGV